MYSLNCALAVAALLAAVACAAGAGGAASDEWSAVLRRFGQLELGENLHFGAPLWGNQRIAGGGSDTKQTQAKSDTLPKYCDPPNPCPLGYTEEDGCMRDVSDTEEYNRRWVLEAQKRGECPCDREHMSSCPRGTPTIASGGDAAAAAHHQLKQLQQREQQAALEEALGRLGESDEEDSDELPQDLQLEGEEMRVVAKKTPVDAVPHSEPESAESVESDEVDDDEEEVEADRP